MDYCNSLFIGLPNVILKKVQSVLNRAARLIFNLPPRVPTTSHLISCIGCLLRQELNLKYVSLLLKLWSLTSHLILGNLSFSSHESTLGLRSANDLYRLHEPRATGERGFANSSFSYIAPHLYNKLPITIKLIDSLNTFKSHLRHFLFPVPMISQVLVFRMIMHCKFLVFLLIVFFFFSFFSSACEFLFIERIGAHGKQNPDFIIIIIIIKFGGNTQGQLRAMPPEHKGRAFCCFDLHPHGNGVRSWLVSLLESYPMCLEVV